jgi:hypothetical protein
MRNVFFVQPEEAETARRMEKILISLPKESGILFAGVSVMQNHTNDERKVFYRVVIGCDHTKDPKIMDLVAKTYLRSEVANESQILIEAFRGLDRGVLALDKLST